MMDLLKRIYPLRLAPVSPDTDRMIEILQKELPFEVHCYDSGKEHNGWTVPDSWYVEKAEIRKDGELIYDGKVHPLGVMGYAKAFQGKVTLSELKEHLTSREDWPEGIGYHCDYFYKPWSADWGFSVPHSLDQSLEEGEYDIDLQTVYKRSEMKVLTHLLPGRTKETIIINAHTCHAGQANDDIAGMVVGVELMKRLAQQNHRFSYLLVLAPEHLGTVFYSAGLSEERIRQLKYGFFLEMLGNNNRLALQETFTGESLLDRACHHYLHNMESDHFSDKFRKIIGNDETVWEAPGIEVPTVSLSRWPYPEYHTSEDNESIIQEDMLEQSVQAVLGIVNILEQDLTLNRKFDGLVALSNPKYDLYFNQKDPSIRPTIAEDQVKWNYFMDCLPRYLNGKVTVLDMAERHDLFFNDVLAYLKKFVEKGLAEFVLPS